MRSLAKQGKGTVVTAADFVTYGSRAAVDAALGRLAREGRLVRVQRGLYYLPRSSSLVGAVPPEPDEVARAIARRRGTVSVPTGERVANELGLSTQVPSQNEYLTEARSRLIPVGRDELVLRHATARRLSAQGAGSRVIEALRVLGKPNIDATAIRQIRSRLSESDRRSVKRALRAAPGWMQPFLRKIAE